jgi:hypothetical protein
VRVGQLLLVVVCAGCGRVGFDALAGTSDAATDAETDAGADADAAVDATGTDAAVMTVTIGGAGSTATTSTYLVGYNRSNNYGRSTDLSIGSQEVGLVRFELAAVPPGSTVTSASLQVWVPDYGDHGMGLVELYPVLEAWTEGTGDGNAGAANWDERATGMTWTTPGCGPGSRDTTPIGTFTVGAPDAYFTVPLAVGPVQTWVNDPATNFGMAIVAARHFHAHSEEAATATRRPILSVTYAPP